MRQLLTALLSCLLFAIAFVPSFAVEPALSGRITGIDAQGRLKCVMDGQESLAPLNALAYWGSYRDVESGPQILLADGGLIRADVLKLDEKSLVLGDATGLGRGLWEESTLPREAIRAILYQPPAGSLPRDKLRDELLSYSGRDDRLLLVGGETVAGLLVSAPLDGPFLPADLPLANQAFRLTPRGASEPLIIPTGKVVALSLAAPVTPQPLPMSATWLGLAEGSLLLVKSAETKDGIVALKLAAGGELKTTLAGRDDPAKTFWDEVKLMQPIGQGAVWLSDLKPLGYKHIPFLSVEWPFGADRSAAGGKLLSGGAVWLKGLGMHSASRLAYDVSGYRQFAAEIALDDTAGLSGSVVFKALLETSPGEWSPAYESPVIRGGDPPTPISIDLKGARRLALIVDFADRGDELDHANWLNARLIK